MARPRPLVPEAAGTVPYRTVTSNFFSSTSFLSNTTTTTTEYSLSLSLSLSVFLFRCLSLSLYLSVSFVISGHGGLTLSLSPFLCPFLLRPARLTTPDLSVSSLLSYTNTLLPLSLFLSLSSLLNAHWLHGHQLTWLPLPDRLCIRLPRWSRIRPFIRFCQRQSGTIILPLP